MSSNKNTNAATNASTHTSVGDGMKQYIKMVVVLTTIAAICGLLLSGVKGMTAVRIEEQILVNVKGPAVKKVLETSTNDLLQDRQTVTVDGQKYVVFVGRKNGKPWAVSFESKEWALEAISA